ncbi:hypothetical protein ACFTXM_25895 [Streptomyces sp. NPDC056930]|uniref:hypothetical protein n=1 Tax=Streptomyces sp. NPDC056930 TaxID=3345967 RepID=UPI003631E132
MSVASKQGNAELPLTKEIGAGTLAIQINCQGKGILNVTVDPVGLSFPLNCVNEEVSSTYNEIHLKRAAGGDVEIRPDALLDTSGSVGHRRDRPTLRPVPPRRLDQVR